MRKIIYKVKVFLEMIKFEHTIFALPFAYLGAFLAYQDIPPLNKLFWVTLAMVGARTAAMALNRIIDRQIDKRNPRTANRALPSGRLNVAEVWIYVFLSFTLLYLAASQLNQLCIRLMPVAVFVLVCYSYIKRISWTCHLVLGVALGLAPLGSWIAITGKFEMSGVLLAIGVGAWVAGFDIFYAAQDWDFDKNQGLHSIPVRFGLKNGFYIAKGLHGLAALMLILVGITMQLGVVYFLGVFVAISLLYYEHKLVSPNDLSKINLAFFNMNGYLSSLMFFFTLLDLIF